MALLSFHPPCAIEEQPLTEMSRPKPGSLAPRDGIYRRGFGLKGEISGDLNEDYHSELIEQIRAEGNRLETPHCKVLLAKEFGFCYGVDKAVDFAYETRRKFPDRRIFLTAEIIHNPRVNRRLLDMGIEFLSGQYSQGITSADLQSQDVVILPAFGISLEELDRLKATGCVLVDTTCGSVVHVWKRVEKYARDGFTSVIHGKAEHEETLATASHARSGGMGHYLIVLDREEAKFICDFIRQGGDPGSLESRFAAKTSPGFDFGRDLERIGVANQTTMLSSESIEIGEMIRSAMGTRYGADHVQEHFRSFDTICGATQERQDAVLEMMENPPELMIVIGGFNSSNTNHLCEIAERFCPTYHIEGPEGLLSPDRILHKPSAKGLAPLETADWLPTRRPLTVGVTAGASTPNRVVGEVIERLVKWSAPSHAMLERPGATTDSNQAI